MRQILLCSALISISPASFSGQIFSAICDEPAGTRIDIVGGKIKHDTDRIAGSHPRFIIYPDRPDKMTIMVSDTKQMGDAARQNVIEAPIINFSENIITAIYRYEDRVDMYSLLPKEGVFYMSTQKYVSLGNGFPVSTSFVGKCKIEASKE